MVEFDFFGLLKIRLTPYFSLARPVGRPRKRHRKDDELCSDSDTQQRKKQLQQQQIQHSRTNSVSADNRHYPFYLLNEDTSQKQSQQ